MPKKKTFYQFQNILLLLGTQLWYRWKKEESTVINKLLEKICLITGSFATFSFYFGIFQQWQFSILACQVLPSENKALSYLIFVILPNVLKLKSVIFRIAFIDFFNLKSLWIGKANLNKENNLLCFAFIDLYANLRAVQWWHESPSAGNHWLSVGGLSDNSQDPVNGWLKDCTKSNEKNKGTSREFFY